MIRHCAAANGRSVEAEARVSDEDAAAADEDSVSWWLDEMASAPQGEPLAVPERGGEPRQIVTFE